MDTTQAKAVFETFFAEKSNEWQALLLIKQIIENGWQSDQDSIAAGIAAGIQVATDPLNARITDLEAQVLALTPVR